MVFSVALVILVCIAPASATLQFAPGLPFSGTFLAPQFAAFGTSHSMFGAMIILQRPDIYASVCLGGLSRFNVSGLVIGYLRLSAPVTRWPSENTAVSCEKFSELRV